MIYDASRRNRMKRGFSGLGGLRERLLELRRANEGAALIERFSDRLSELRVSQE